MAHCVPTPGKCRGADWRTEPRGEHKRCRYHTGREALSRLAEAYREKYRDEWDFDNDDKVFDPNGNRTHVVRVAPAKVIAFAKSPHGQTTFRFQT